MEKEIKCPKCGSQEVSKKYSNGGPAIYRHLECEKCGFSGGLVRVYEGENDRVERQIRERFKIDNDEDDCKAFVSSILGY